MYSFSYLEPVCCSMSSSNCCFLTCIDVSQEAGQVVWYSHLFQSFPQFSVIHTVKGFGIVNKAEIDILLELSCFFDDPAMWGVKCMSLSTTQTRSVDSQISCSMCDSCEEMSLKDHNSMSWWQGNAGLSVPMVLWCHIELSKCIPRT